MRNFIYRIFVTLLNLFFPPLAVGLLDHFSTDCLVNSCLFLCGVLPSHIHGFYISCVYFSRRRKVRKGRYPGGRKPFIQTDAILNGGASNVEVRKLWEKSCGEKEAKGGRRRSRDRREGDDKLGYENWNYAGGNVSRVGSRRSEAGRPGRMPSRRSNRW